MDAFYIIILKRVLLKNLNEIVWNDINDHIVDPKGWLPAWLVNTATRNFAPSIIDNLKKVSKGGTNFDLAILKWIIL
jgi:hypothetical protein